MKFETSLQHLHEAQKRRRSLMGELKSWKTNAYRLFCGRKEGIPGLIIDCYDKVSFFQVHEGHCPLDGDTLQKLASELVSQGRAHSVYLKRFVPDRSRQVADDSMYEKEPLAGKPAPSEFLIFENGLRYWIRPFDGFSVGLFLDQRIHRRILAEAISGWDVFNGFAYTCGFSVACAKAGATVTSVDLSPKYLEWGKRNFTTNRIHLEGHRFYADDVFRVLERDLKKKRQYDLLILDPPTFSRSKKHGTFSLKKQLAPLLQLGLETCKPGGQLFFSCNYSEWTHKDLEAAMQKLSVPIQTLRLPPPPLDFAKAEHPLSCIRVKRAK